MYVCVFVCEDAIIYNWLIAQQSVPFQCIKEWREWDDVCSFVRVQSSSTNIFHRKFSTIAKHFLPMVIEDCGADLRNRKIQINFYPYLCVATDVSLFGSRISLMLVELVRIYVIVYLLVLLKTDQTQTEYRYNTNTT